MVNIKRTHIVFRMTIICGDTIHILYTDNQLHSNRKNGWVLKIVSR